MSLVRKCDYPVFDADHHLYETQDAFTRHLPKEYKGYIDYVTIRGRTKLVLKGHISNYIPNPTFEVVARPGAHEAYYRDGNPEGKTLREITGEPMKSIAAFREPGAKLELMDKQGVDRTLNFPTLASVLEEHLCSDINATHAIVHSLNQWLHETWSFNYKDRIFTTPVITLPIVEKAIEELEWVLERGAKVILVRPAPVPGFTGKRSFALEEFDPFWKRVVDSGVLVAMHASDSGYAAYQADWTGKRDEMRPFEEDAFRQTQTKRPIEDAMLSAICHGLFRRNPGLKIAAIENGGSWVASALKNLALAYKKMPQAFAENPAQTLRRHVYVAPFFEDDLGEVIEAMGGTSNVLFGSDYPHPEGLEEPTRFTEYLPGGLTKEDVKKIMGGNLGKLMGYEGMVS